MTLQTTKDPYPEKGPEGAKTPTKRTEILLEASRLIDGDRNHTYGSPTQNFTNISEFWTTFLKHKLKDEASITPEDVACLMILVKVARGIAGSKLDNATDAAGYAGIWGELIDSSSE